MPVPADDHYWSVDIPGLTEGEGEQLVAWVEAKHLGSVGAASAVDPMTFLTLHLDRASAQALYDGVMSNAETATPERGLAEILSQWLQRSSPSQ